MIVKNEEAVLERCLRSCKGIFDEIIIVDTGSTDSTKQIAKKFTNKVYDFVWADDFSLARNFSFTKCTCDYIMWLDADDVISKSNNLKLKKLKQNLKQFDTVMIKYNVSFDENKKPTFSFYRERILKNDGSFVWHDPVHEVITPHGNIFYANISVDHMKVNKIKKQNRNLKIYQNLIRQKVKLSARQQYYYARELMFNFKYKKAIKEFNKFLKMPNAFKENLIGATKDLSYCYLKLNCFKQAKNILIQSFNYDLPRADICCRLGDIFLYENNYQQSIFWYEIALKNKPDIKSGAFVEWQYFTTYPCLQLCVCYYKINNFKKAICYNNKAGKFDKTNKYYLNNLKFFKTKKDAV